MNKSEFSFLFFASIIIIVFLLVLQFFYPNYNNEKVTEQAPAPIHVTRLQSSGSTTYTTRFYNVEYKDEEGDTYTFLACTVHNGITMELLKVNGQLVSGIPRENISK